MPWDTSPSHLFKVPQWLVLEIRTRDVAITGEEVFERLLVRD